MATHPITPLKMLVDLSETDSTKAVSSTTEVEINTSTTTAAGEEESHTSTAMARVSQVLAALRSLAKNAVAVGDILRSWLARICLIREEQVKTLSPTSTTTSSTLSFSQRKTLKQFNDEVEILLSHGTNQKDLLRFSEGLQRQFRNALQHNMSCMLPSYNHQLPHGHEKGTFLALDVGGSTFRVALVELLGSDVVQGQTKIIAQKSYKITNSVKRLKDTKFFDWMAERIEATIVTHQPLGEDNMHLQMGLAWSFPIEQTSLRSGFIQGMGKGFLAADGLLGHDLGDVIEQACQRRGLDLTVSAIVNDGTATLLSQAYSIPSTRFGLILGTGVNIAVDLPTHAISPKKFGTRSPSWHAAAQNVLVNTELGMFGRDLLPLTKWDSQLNQNHERPDFQPLEHLVSGRYLGELVRLLLLDASSTTTLFNGTLPPSLENPYTLDTEVISRMSSATSTTEARSIFTTSHPTTSTLSDEEINLITNLAHHVSLRSSGIIAASLHALWQLRKEAHKNNQTHDHTNQEQEPTSHSAIACNGSVIQSYPGFRENCQRFLDGMVGATGGVAGTLDLQIAHESSLIGAAVAVACL